VNTSSFLTFYYGSIKSRIDYAEKIVKWKKFHGLPLASCSKGDPTILIVFMLHIAEGSCNLDLIPIHEELHPITAGPYLFVSRLWRFVRNRPSR